MKTVTLQPAEIEKLFIFTRSKYVRYRDVQHEIVDHLASGIEELMSIDHTLSFDSALKMVYGRFPVTGFTHFVANKEKETLRYWQRKMWKFIKSYFRMPKILILLALMSVITYVILRVPQQSITREFFLIFSTISLTMSLIPMIRHQRNKPKDILIINAYNQVVVGGHLTSIYLITNPFFSNAHLPNITTWPFIGIVLFAFFISLFMITIYASYFVFPSVLEEELKNKYAHLELV